MTLFKQMALTLTLFLTTILLYMMVLNFQTATAFVQNHLYTNSNNTAHSLGLSLSKIADPNDTASMETMINAIYDSGYYEKITLTLVDGKEVYTRTTDVYVSDVPQWFISKVKIVNAIAFSDIMMGWNRFGRLEISGHTGHAYKQLYDTFKELIQTFIVSGFFILAILYVLLSMSLKSLRQIRAQAQGIIENHFIIESKMPFTTEFRSVTVAMNAMVKKVKDIFERENETLIQYQELLYKDSESKLYNRRYLLTKLPEYLKFNTHLSQGLYDMLSIDELDRFKKEHGYDEYARFIESIAEKLNHCTELSEGSFLVRLNEGEFFLILPCCELTVLKVQCDELLRDLQKELDTDSLSYLVIGLGIGEYSEKDTVKTLLSRGDLNVAQAKQNEDFGLCVETSNASTLVLSRDEWRQELLQAFKTESFIFAAQNAMHFEAEQTSLLHQEIFVRLKRYDRSIHSAGVFIPMATTLGLVDEIDRYMITKMFDSLASERCVYPVALNLGAEFIKKYVNMEWLKENLSRLTPQKRARISFEVSHTIALHNIEAMISLASTLRAFGCRLGIDNYTIPEEGVFSLSIIRPHYIKSTFGYLKDMMIETHTGKIKESIHNVASSLGFDIIVTNVETQEELEMMQKWGFYDAQGRFVSPIEFLN